MASTKTWIEESLARIHSSWQNNVHQAVQAIPKDYLEFLSTSSLWLPGQEKWLNVFQTPKNSIRFILYGESPYPRQISANGYAFWDAAVGNIWSESGLDKKVNRATSLRHWIKMLLIAEGLLSPENTTQNAIVNIVKDQLVQDLDSLFKNFIQAGFLLLNANLALTSLGKTVDQLASLPFQRKILQSFIQDNSLKPPALLLFGKIAETLLSLEETQNFITITAKHPYNLSFVTDPKVIKFFQPLHLLRKRE